MMVLNEDTSVDHQRPVGRSSKKCWANAWMDGGSNSHGDEPA
jgi:hypothetical protein